MVPSDQQTAEKMNLTLYVPKDAIRTVNPNLATLKVSHGGGPKNGAEYFGVDGFSIRDNNKEVFAYTQGQIKGNPLICMLKTMLCIITSPPNIPPVQCLIEFLTCAVL